MVKILNNFDYFALQKNVVLEKKLKERTEESELTCNQVMVELNFFNG